MTRQDFQAINRVGRVLRTFATFDLAHAWAKQNALLHPGVRIDCVEVTTTTKTVYQPRPRLVAHDLDVPAIPLRRAG